MTRWPRCANLLAFGGAIALKETMWASTIKPCPSPAAPGTTKQEKTTPKTASSHRIIPLDNDTFKLLQGWQAQQKK
jgi:hypothetical protein